jgi:hypothetical protein
VSEWQRAEKEEGKGAVAHVWRFLLARQTAPGEENKKSLSDLEQNGRADY